MLTGGLVARGGGGAGDGGIDTVEKRLARSMAEIESAGLHQVLEHALVDGAAIDALGEIGEIGERPVLLALLDDFLRGEFTDTFDAGQTEANGRFATIRS